MHPNCIGLFCFDQSSNHAAMPEDALKAQNMNLKPGGKQPKLRDGWYARGEQRIQQPMQFEDGTPKGIRAVLEERGLWPSGRILLECTDSCSEACCARKIMASQPDFQEQKSSLEEAIEKKGHLVTFYPKFHCECNFIERFWGEGKRKAREECDYSHKSLTQRVPRILSSIPLSHIRAYHRKAWRYIHSYSMGLGGAIADWAVKKYRSHRRIPEKAERLIEEFGQSKS